MQISIFIALAAGLAALFLGGAIGYGACILVTRRINERREKTRTIVITVDTSQAEAAFQKLHAKVTDLKEDISSLGIKTSTGEDKAA